MLGSFISLNLFIFNLSFVIKGYRLVKLVSYEDFLKTKSPSQSNLHFAKYKTVFSGKRLLKIVGLIYIFLFIVNIIWFSVNPSPTSFRLLVDVIYVPLRLLCVFYLLYCAYKIRNEPYDVLHLRFEFFVNIILLYIPIPFLFLLTF